MRLREINALVLSTADPSFAVDGAGCVAAWNGGAETLFGLSAAEAIGRPCCEIMRGSDACGRVCSANCTPQQAVRKRHPVGNFDLQFQTASGPQWCNISVLIADAESGTTTPYAIHIVQQIDFRKRLELLVHEFVVTGTGMTAEQAAAMTSSSRSPAREIELSPRELEVLTLLAQGVSTIDIGGQLHISHATVNNHVQHILRKLDAHTRLEAIRRAEHAGLI